MTAVPTVCSTGQAGAPGTRLLWRSLEQDHDQIWDLINFLTGGAGEPEGTERERRKVALRLVAVESAHEAAEELVVWPALESAISTEEADRLGRIFRHERRRAPTRPHPHTPPMPSVLRSMGRAVALVGRARDLVVLRDKV